MKRLISILLILIICVSPPFSAAARSVILDAAQVDATAFTALPALAVKLQEIFAGQIGLYADKAFTQQVSLPLGTSMSITQQFYVPNGNGVTAGKQCFIYANAVYNALFGETVGKATNLRFSQVVLSGGNQISYEKMQQAGVTSGAYIRTTELPDGSYDGNSGHSMLVLYYDAESITYLEGNADNKGLIRITIESWAEFNASKLEGKGRYLCHIVQPTAQRLEALYGQPDLICDLGHVVKPQWQTVLFPTVSSGGKQQIICDRCAQVLSSKETAPYVDTAKIFEDISAKDWFYKNDAVNFAYSDGIFVGMSEKRFEPNTPLTRGMLVTVLGRMRGIDQYDVKGITFTDVKPNQYYAPFVAWAAEEGLVHGFQDGTFRPNENVTREQLCKVMALFCNAPDVQGEKFADDAAIARWAREYVYACKELGIIQGKPGGVFDGKSGATRAEVATILYNIEKM